MSVDLIIFDCDGVLVDSESIAVDVDRRILKEFGWELTREEAIEKFLGRSWGTVERELSIHLGRPLERGWDEPYREWFSAAFAEGLRPVEGVTDALDRITLPTCIASSGSHEKLRMTLGLTGLLGGFQGRIFSADDVRHGKPEPDLFLHAARVIGASPERCLVVEDSVSGVRAARAAGMHALGFAGGLTPKEWLSIEGAQVFEQMLDLPGLIASLGRAPA